MKTNSPTSAHNAPTLRKRKDAGTIQYELQTLLVFRVNDNIGRTIHFKLTHSKSIEDMGTLVWDSKEWKKANAATKAYVNGYYQARRDEIYRHNLEWCLYIDGALHTKEAVKQLVKSEIDSGKSKEPNYDSPYMRCNSDKSAHVWKGHLDKPY